MITERLLQFIWQHQYFNTDKLCTADNQSLQILKAGAFNHDQGPDFLDARIRIGKEVWVGNVELHIDSGDWFRHTHDQDPNYANVILHVVWCDSGRHPPGIAVLVLQHRVSVMLLDQYRQWMSGMSFIPCNHAIATVHGLVWLNWKERLIAQRLEQKAAKIAGWLTSNQFYWEETLWWMVARNFGLRVNADAFEAMARSIPYVSMLRHREALQQLEALFLGQTGLLEKRAEDQYTRDLKKEYRFLARKYRLKRITVPVHFLRMRPSSFPTLRLAQLAMLVHSQGHLLQTVLDSSLTSLREVFNQTIGGYWDTHYLLGKPSEHAKKSTGGQLIQGMLINVVVPFLFVYGKHFNNPEYVERAGELLYDLPAEDNHVITAFKKLGVRLYSAADSQFLLELKRSYCSQWRCLDCAVGNHILRTGGKGCKM